MKTQNSLKLISIVIILLVSSLSSNAQTSQLTGINQLKYGDFIDLQKNSATRDLKPGKYKGSPYLNNNFLIGHIIMNDTVQYNDVPLRYNIFNEQIEYKISDTSYLAIFYPEKITELIIDGRKFIYTDKARRRFKTKGFYEVLYDGELQLLVKYHVDFKYEEKALGYNSAKPPRFIRRINTLYSKTENKKPKRIASKNQLKKVFGKILSDVNDNPSSNEGNKEFAEITKLLEERLRHRQSRILGKQVNQSSQKTTISSDKENELSGNVN